MTMKQHTFSIAFLLIATSCATEPAKNQPERRMRLRVEANARAAVKEKEIEAVLLMSNRMRYAYLYSPTADRIHFVKKYFDQLYRDSDRYTDHVQCQQNPVEYPQFIEGLKEKIDRLPKEGNLYGDWIVLFYVDGARTVHSLPRGYDNNWTNLDPGYTRSPQTQTIEFEMIKTDVGFKAEQVPPPPLRKNSPPPNN